MMDDAIQPSCAPSVTGGKVRFESLGENLCPALCSNTSQQADAVRDDDTPAGDREIRQSAGAYDLTSYRTSVI